MRRHRTWRQTLPPISVYCSALRLRPAALRQNSGLLVQTADRRTFPFPRHILRVLAFPALVNVQI